MQYPSRMKAQDAQVQNRECPCLSFVVAKIPDGLYERHERVKKGRFVRLLSEQAKVKTDMGWRDVNTDAKVNMAELHLFIKSKGKIKRENKSILSVNFVLF